MIGVRSSALLPLGETSGRPLGGGGRTAPSNFVDLCTPGRRGFLLITGPRTRIAFLVPTLRRRKGLFDALPRFWLVRRFARRDAENTTWIITDYHC